MFLTLWKPVYPRIQHLHLLWYLAKSVKVPWTYSFPLFVRTGKTQKRHFTKVPETLPVEAYWWCSKVTSDCIVLWQLTGLCYGHSFLWSKIMHRTPRVQAPCWYTSPPCIYISVPLFSLTSKTGAPLWTEDPYVHVWYGSREHFYWLPVTVQHSFLPFFLWHWGPKCSRSKFLVHCYWFYYISFFFWRWPLYLSVSQ